MGVYGTKKANYGLTSLLVQCEIVWLHCKHTHKLPYYGIFDRVAIEFVYQNSPLLLNSPQLADKATTAVTKHIYPHVYSLFKIIQI